MSLNHREIVVREANSDMGVSDVRAAGLFSLLGSCEVSLLHAGFPRLEKPGKGVTVKFIVVIVSKVGFDLGDESLLVRLGGFAHGFHHSIGQIGGI